MDVSFIIVNYNSTALAISCIHSIQTYTRDIAYEILVVDNASPDDDANLLLTRFPNRQACKLAENRGVGAANNLALAQAKGAFVFFLNPDTELTHNAARQFADYLQKPEHKHIAICGAHLFNESPQGTPSYGNFPGFWQSLASAGPYLLFRSYYYQHLDTGVVNKLDQTREVDYVSGAAMFIRRSIIQQVNGFDEHFFLYFEETDLCKRVNNAGYKTMLIPSIKIRHKEGVTDGRQKTIMAARAGHILPGGCRSDSRDGQDGVRKFVGLCNTRGRYGRPAPAGCGPGNGR